ncbi:S-layer homology domain-containing protein [Paenibacillus sp. GSMTC-2017]|uniref:M13-type metalloendopeptidase n=1 Tax=Paenibacillus sp. GSMTC-2017 TaxID=2794350 RepID=UPI0018D6EFD5|nr:M13-type metalloendopeptidase [Paenibacillus sp. GSMTC-2017]MBH5319424.1 S-layer homology domain-containing protein [Paenibacillus sp. GSMTC-2017]
MKKHYLALPVAIAMALSVSASAYAGATKPLPTRGEIVQTLLTSADAYNTYLQKGTIIQGYENGDLKENEPIKKIEALVMLSRAFGDLPEPVGNDLRVGTFGVKFSDIPAWAKGDIDKLLKAGVLAGKPDGTLGANDTITMSDFQKIVTRVWALEGSYLNDDFYEAINKNWLKQSTIALGDFFGGGIPEMHKLNNDNVTEMIDELTGKSFAPGTKERKLTDFYAIALDTEKRNKQGIEPIKKYVNAIDGAKTIGELIQADLMIEKELALSTLFRFTIMADAKNSNENALHYTGLKTGLYKFNYVTEDATAKQLYIDQITKYLVLTGEKESTAKTRAENVYEMEKNLAAVSLDVHEQGDVNKFYNPYTIEQFDEMLKEPDMKQAMKSMKLDHVDKVIVTDVKLAQKGAEFMTDANLDVLKAYAKAQLLAETGWLLTDEIRKVSSDFYSALYGVVGTKTDKEIAISATKGALAGYLEQMFAEKHFSPEAKKDVEQMVEKLIVAYEDRINKLDWMSETTKANAIKKLKSMKVKVGYPDKWDTTLDQVTIKSYEDGGSLFSNSYAATSALQNAMKASLGKPVDKSKWSTEVYTVNAFYNTMNNDLTFPAGILQAPFYDINAKPEENLGGIGTLIGHEISHAFDKEGAAYDEHGNATNWWTDEDLKKFDEKCQQLIAFYDGIEIVPGAMNNGLNTLSENASDLAGMAVALQVASKLESPDYKAFFENHAVTNKYTTTKEFATMISGASSHSADKVRVNRTVVNFEEFYEAYEIKPGDGMYVAPKDRVSIW